MTEALADDGKALIIVPPHFASKFVVQMNYDETFEDAMDIDESIKNCEEDDGNFRDLVLHFLNIQIPRMHISKRGQCIRVLRPAEFFLRLPAFFHN